MAPHGVLGESHIYQMQVDAAFADSGEFLIMGLCLFLQLPRFFDLQRYDLGFSCNSVQNQYPSKKWLKTAR